MQNDEIELLVEIFHICDNDQKKEQEIKKSNSKKETHSIMLSHKNFLDRSDDMKWPTTKYS